MHAQNATKMKQCVQCFTLVGPKRLREPKERSPSGKNQNPRGDLERQPRIAKHQRENSVRQPLVDKAH